MLRDLDVELSKLIDEIVNDVRLVHPRKHWVCMLICKIDECQAGFPSDLFHEEEIVCNGGRQLGPTGHLNVLAFQFSCLSDWNPQLTAWNAVSLRSREPNFRQESQGL